MPVLFGEEPQPLSRRATHFNRLSMASKMLSIRQDPVRTLYIICMMYYECTDYRILSGRCNNLVVATKRGFLTSVPIGLYKSVEKPAQRCKFDCCNGQTKYGRVVTRLVNAARLFFYFLKKNISHKKSIGVLLTTVTLVCQRSRWSPLFAAVKHYRLRLNIRSMLMDTLVQRILLTPLCLGY